jgi:hypothetical protein
MFLIIASTSPIEIGVAAPAAGVVAAGEPAVAVRAAGGEPGAVDALGVAGDEPGAVGALGGADDPVAAVVPGVADLVPKIARAMLPKMLILVLLAVYYLWPQTPFTPDNHEGRRRSWQGVRHGGPRWATPGDLS